DVNAAGCYFGTALLAAAYGWSERVVRLLVENHAVINTTRGHYGSVLQAATYAGHITIVRLLVENQPRTTLPGSQYVGALEAAASEWGHDATVVRLLVAGADVNIQGDRSGYALEAASAKDYVEIVGLLLQAGA
ncbi:ankyrin, partial [Thozetella sp. PMI_491]